jgi:hypothetical protein
MRATTRSVVVHVLVGVAALAVGVAVLAAYAQHTFVDSNQFANRASAALQDERTRNVVARHVTDDLVLAQQGDLVAARPLIESAVSGVVGGGAFGGLFRSSVRDVHRALVQEDESTLTLTLADVGLVVAAALEQVRPDLARQVEDSGAVTLVTTNLGTAGERAVRVADEIRFIAIAALLVAIAAAAGAFALSRDRRGTVVRLGAGTTIAGVLIAAACAIAKAQVVGAVARPEDADAAAAVWDAFLGDLRTAGWVLAGCGAIVAAAAASLLRPVDLGRHLEHAAQAIAAEPSTPAWRALRGVALVAAGVLVLVARDAVLDLLVTALGAYLVYAGVTILLRLVAPARGADERAEDVRRAPRRRSATVGAVAVVLLALLVGTFVAGGGTTEAAPASTVCNGHEELCDRRLDEVALAATHNSMAVPLPGWFASEQDAPIGDQLDDGIRGLLIDTYYADKLPNGRLRTVIDDASQLRRKALEDGVSVEQIDAALRLRDRAGFQGEGERGMYLCHSFCELGGTPVGEVLDTLRDFLVAHPGEIVVVVVQDAVEPADFVAEVEQAGLAGLAYSGPVDGEWPTLQELIDRGERVVFLAEERAGGAPWFHLAYEQAMQETPFTFRGAQALIAPQNLVASCAANRGPDGAPLLLLNHWVAMEPLPLPSDAEKVNAYEPLLRRARTCERVRGQIPNLIAVNFYRRGDVFRVVDTLNGVG